MGWKNEFSGGRSSRMAALAGMFAIGVFSPAKADIAAFNYDPITDNIVSATFSVDFAEMVARRDIAGFEVNGVVLLDLGAGVGNFDMSNELFGAFGSAPLINMAAGSGQTGRTDVTIPASFFPALAGGSVGLWAAMTDTDDGIFAIDFMSLTIDTEHSGMIEAFYNTANDGFGLGIADGINLGGALINTLPLGGNPGEDEVISGKGVEKVPAPASVLLGLLGLGFVSSVRRRLSRSSSAS